MTRKIFTFDSNLMYEIAINDTFAYAIELSSNTDENYKIVR
ncbi:hypothetical protein [Flavobacterium sp.]|jgi:hypothetical protein